ncbi:hypothetical protein FE257_001315 [Aspergillus nanangensis]|uniref:Uncharacterized protein n=1 Tax=Aspergillus nanangensis TaxID=2582783 RepID=A0AAD4CEG1_ASPNN|nr:hypothetical protein FE257_001315 [Aspergillus nanangensis]
MNILFLFGLLSLQGACEQQVTITEYKAETACSFDVAAIEVTSTEYSTAIFNIFETLTVCEELQSQDTASFSTSKGDELPSSNKPSDGIITTTITQQTTTATTTTAEEPTTTTTTATTTEPTTTNTTEQPTTTTEETTTTTTEESTTTASTETTTEPTTTNTTEQPTTTTEEPTTTTEEPTTTTTTEEPTTRIWPTTRLWPTTWFWPTKTTSCPTPTPTPGCYDYGDCTPPTISYDADAELYEIDDVDIYGHGESPTIDTLTSHICNQLRSPCNAPQDTVDACWASAATVTESGLEGQAACDLWNSLI